MRQDGLGSHKRVLIVMTSSLLVVSALSICLPDLSVSPALCAAATDRTASQEWLKSLLQNKTAVHKLFEDSGLKTELSICKETNIYSPKYGVTLCWMSIPAQRTTMIVKDIQRSGIALQIYADHKEEFDIAVVNGGFFGLNSLNRFVPLGLIISEGRVKNKRTNWRTGGVITQTAKSIQITPIRSFTNSGSTIEAIQSKPLLVNNGKVEIYSDDYKLFNRTAVGLDSDKNVIVAGAFSDNGKALSLFEFASFLATPRAHGGPAVGVALAMDGGPGAHLFFPTLNLHFGEPGDNFVPNTIHFKRRL